MKVPVSKILAVAIVAFSGLCAQASPDKKAESEWSFHDATPELLERSVRIKRFFLPSGGELVFGMSRSQPKKGESPVEKLYALFPSLFVQDKGQWKAVTLEGPFSKYDWAYMAGSPEEGKFWGFLEWTVESPKDALVVVSSMDGGKTWKRWGTLPKPGQSGMIRDFRMDSKGHGKVLFEVEGDEKQVISRDGSHIPSKPARWMLYAAMSDDWGKTWHLDKQGTPDILEKGDLPFWKGTDCQEALRAQSKIEQPCRIVP